MSAHVPKWGVVVLSPHLVKFPVGPTISKPGPTLLIEVNTAVDVVIKSKPSRETIIIAIRAITV